MVLNNKLFYAFGILIFVVSCTDKKAVSKNVDIDSYITLTIPSNYSFHEKKGIDSYVFELSDGNGVVLKGDLGHYSYDLVEPNFPVFDLAIRDSILKRTNNQLDSNVLHFSEYPETDYELRIFSKQYYQYDTINGVIARVAFPKRHREGIYGVYFPKLKDGRRLSLYTENLDSLKFNIVQDIFHSIKYK